MTSQQQCRNHGRQLPLRAVASGHTAGVRPAAARRAGGRDARLPAGRGTGVLLVAGDALYRCGLRSLLEGQPDLDVVGEACDGHEAAEILRHVEPNVVLLGPRGPGTDPVEVICRLNGQAVLVLASPTGEALDEAEVLRAGASGLLRDTATPAELAAALRVVAAGYTLRRLPAAAVSEGPRPALPREFLSLTAREQQVFRYLTAGLGNAEIATALSLGECTIKSHVQHLLTKLGIPNRVHAVIYAYRHGLAASPGSEVLTAA